MLRLPSLVRSGWWVAVAGGAVAVGLLVLALRAPRHEHALGDGRTVASYGFDLSSSLVPASRIVPAGMPRDGLLALNEPAMLTVAEVEATNREGRGKFLLPGLPEPLRSDIGPVPCLLSADTDGPSDVERKRV